MKLKRLICICIMVLFISLNMTACGEKASSSNASNKEGMISGSAK